SRRGRDITRPYPELGGLAAAWSGNGAVLDGEIVVLGSGTSPSFGALQQRMHLPAAEVRRLATAVPVTYLAFDLLYADGRLLLDAHYRDRRALLDALALDGPRCQSPPSFGREPRAH